MILSHYWFNSSYPEHIHFSLIQIHIIRNEWFLFNLVSSKRFMLIFLKKKWSQKYTLLFIFVGIQTRGDRQSAIFLAILKMRSFTVEYRHREEGCSWTDFVGFRDTTLRGHPLLSSNHLTTSLLKLKKKNRREEWDCRIPSFSLVNGFFNASKASYGHR